MKIHQFLTGEKGCGKSTFIKKYLAEHSFGCIKGFYTLRTANPDGSYSVHILRAGCNDTPCEDNLLFYCGPYRSRHTDEEIIKHFNDLGCHILEDVDGADLLIMDELGPHEELATDFKNRVLELLDGEIPILGVVQRAESHFLDEIKNHPKVQIKEIVRNF